MEKLAVLKLEGKIWFSTEKFNFMASMDTSQFEKVSR